MSWPIGFGKPGHRYTSTLDGTVHVDSVPVTQPNGWILVAPPPQVRGPSFLDAVTMRVRLSVDREGHPFLYAEQVEVGAVRFSGVHAWAQNGGAAWLPWLAGCVHDAMIRALEQRLDAGATEHDARANHRARSEFVVERPSISADETWRGQRAVVNDSANEDGSARLHPNASAQRPPRPRRRRRSTGDASP